MNKTILSQVKEKYNEFGIENLEQFRLWFIEFYKTISHKLTMPYSFIIKELRSYRKRNIYYVPMVNKDYTWVEHAIEINEENSLINITNFINGMNFRHYYIGCLSYCQGHDIVII